MSRCFSTLSRLLFFESLLNCLNGLWLTVRLNTLASFNRLSLDISIASIISNDSVMYVWLPLVSNIFERMGEIPSNGQEGSNFFILLIKLIEKSGSSRVFWMPCLIWLIEWFLKQLFISNIWWVTNLIALLKLISNRDWRHQSETSNHDLMVGLAKNRIYEASKSWKKWWRDEEAVSVARIVEVPSSKI